MIVYFDTSALIKKYFHESFTNRIIELWKKSDDRVTSAVTFAELLATTQRKAREQPLLDEVINELIRQIKMDWETFIRVEVNTTLNKEVERLTAKYSLRGFDAIHLASATLIQKSINESLIFACFDKSLFSAAKAEGLKLFPEEF